jgi:tetratricopeptide (TPR) repeat protein
MWRIGTTKSVVRAARLALTLAAATLASPAWAQPSPGPEGSAGAAAVEQQDEDAVLAARADSGNGILAIGPHVEALQAVLARAPAAEPRIEERDGKVFYHVLFAHDAVEYAAWRKARGQPDAEIVEVTYTYPLAAFLLGTYFNERRRPDTALAALHKGLSLAPDDPTLVSETGIALFQLKRFDDAIALFDGELGRKDFVRTLDRARILRAKGFALTELGRLDEAETAYRESLKLEPGHLGALHELQYIAGLKAGRAPTKGSMVTSDQARKGEIPPPN